MPSYVKIILTGSTQGRAIPVTGVAPSTANTIHTAVTDTGGGFDELYIWAVNTATATREITLRWGCTVTGQGIRHMSVQVTQLSGPVLMIPGWPLNGGDTVRAYVTIADQVAVYGYAHRYAT